MHKLLEKAISHFLPKIVVLTIPDLISRNLPVVHTLAGTFSILRHESYIPVIQSSEC